MNTNWSSPKTNFLAGLNDLRKCLASGHNARLIRLRNEECEFPIRKKNVDKDFRNYEFYIGYASSVNKIKESTNMSDMEKYLTLNYVNVFGTREAVEKYYSTGELSADNFKSAGVSHLIQVDDMIKFLEINDPMRVKMYRDQYRSPEHVNDTSHFFDFYRYKFGSRYAIKKFKYKLWVVEMLNEQPELPAIQRILMKVINGLVYPLKFIPSRKVMEMKEYKVITYRIGSVINGYTIDIQVPKKFSFK